MNILLGSTAIAVGFGMLVVLLSFRTTRAQNMNEKMELASRQLVAPGLPLALAGICIVFAFIYQEVWVSGVAAVLGLTGVAGYFKRLRLFMQKYHFAQEQAHRKVLGIWLAWLILFVLTIVHGVYVLWV